MSCQYHLRLFGQVQGVGLRYAVKQQAIKMGLKGFVRNLDDGSVELVINGQLKKFISCLYPGLNGNLAGITLEKLKL